MGEQENGYVDTLSGNDLGDNVTGGQEPDTGDTDVSGGQTPGQDEGTGGSEPDTGHDTENKDDKEVSDSADREQYEQIITIIEDDDSKEWREEISERMTELMKPQDTTDVTERLDSLIMLLTPDEEEVLEEEMEAYAVDIPFDGYTSWDYPVEVQFQVYPYGAGYWMKQTESLSDMDSFTARYGEIVALCQEGGTLKDFYVEYIWDNSGDLVYDYEAQTPEPAPDPGDEEQKEVTEQLLTHLENINTTLSDMVQADMEYYQAVKDYQAEMLKLTTADTGLTFVTCLGVFAIFAVLFWSQFFGRFK